MCLFGGGKPKIPDTPAPPSETGAAVSARRESRERQRAQGLSGRSSTLLTGTGGVQNQTTAKKTLLGS